MITWTIFKKDRFRAAVNVKVNSRFCFTQSIMKNLFLMSTSSLKLYGENILQIYTNNLHKTCSTGTLFSANGIFFFQEYPKTFKNNSFITQKPAYTNKSSIAHYTVIMQEYHPSIVLSTRNQTIRPSATVY